MRRFQYQLVSSTDVLITDAQGYEVRIALRGRFPSDVHRREYVEELMRALNAAPIPTQEHTRWPMPLTAVSRGTERHACF